MAGLGKLNAELHRFPVADLADQDDVRCLAQGILQRGEPGLGIDADLALRDDAVVVGMHVLDRILDRDDVTVRILVAMTDHRGQRRRLTRTGRADDDDEAALRHRDILQDRRQLEILDGRNLRDDLSQDRTDGPLLDERADTEASDPLRTDREIAFLRRIELAGLLVVHDRANDDRTLILAQRLLGRRPNIAVDLDGRRETGRDEEVGPALVHQLLQEALHQACSLVALHSIFPHRCSDVLCHARSSS